MKNAIDEAPGCCFTRKQEILGRDLGGSVAFSGR